MRLETVKFTPSGSTRARSQACPGHSSLCKLLTYFPEDKWGHFLLSTTLRLQVTSQLRQNSGKVKSVLPSCATDISTPLLFPMLYLPSLKPNSQLLILRKNLLNKSSLTFSSSHPKWGFLHFNGGFLRYHFSCSGFQTVLLELPGS